MNRLDKGGSKISGVPNVVRRYFPILSARLTTTVSE
jgi:hypothetical protein